MADILARTRLIVGTTAQWAANDIVLGDGELALEIDGADAKAKVGDGSSAFSASPYLSLGGTGLTADVVTALADKLDLAGGTLTGDLLLPTISGTPDPNQAVTAQWVEDNAQVVFATPVEVAAGTADDVAIAPNTLASAAIASRTSTADAGKIIKTDASGFLSETFLKLVDEIITDNDDYAGQIPQLNADGFLDANFLQYTFEFVSQGETQYKFVRTNADGFIDQSLIDAAGSGGAGSENKIVTLDASGLIDASLLDAVALHTGITDAGKFILLDGNGYLSDSFVNAVTSGGSSAVAGRLAKLDGNGKFDSSLIPDSAIGIYLGQVDVSDPLPNPITSYSQGDFYIASVDVNSNQIDNDWDIVNSGNGNNNDDVIAQDMLIFNGTNWDHIGNSSLLNGYLLLDGSSAMTGALAMGGNKVTNLANGSNAQDAVAYGQLGSAAFSDEQSNTLDTTAGRLLLNGAFGLGATSLASGNTTANLNTLTASGLYHFTSGATGAPSGVSGDGLVIHAALSGSTTGQQYAANNGNVWHRSRTGGTWGAWVAFTDGDNQIFTDVSDNASDIASAQSDISALQAFDATLGTAATEDVQTSSYDSTAARLLQVGAFGLGAASLDSAVDLDTLTVSGLYRFAATEANRPFDHGTLLSINRFGNEISQLAIGTRSLNVQMRYKDNNSNWSGWQKIPTNAVQSNYLDTTANALMLVGAFGLGNTAQTVSNLLTANRGQLGRLQDGVTTANQLPDNESDVFGFLNVPVSGSPLSSVLLAIGLDTVEENEPVKAYIGAHDQTEVNWKRLLTSDDIQNGSGLNADFLDGLDSTEFVQASGNQNITGNKTITGLTTLTNNSNPPLTIDGTNSEKIILTGANDPFLRFRENTTDKAIIQWNSGLQALRLRNIDDDAEIYLKSPISFTPDSGANVYRIWHEGNDGAGSGLDADTVDGVQANDLMQLSGVQTANGSKKFTGQLLVGPDASNVLNTTVDNMVIADGFYVRGQSSGSGNAFFGLVNTSNDWVSRFALDPVENSWTLLKDGSNPDPILSIAGHLKATVGNVTTPALSFNTTNTEGIYSPAAGSVAFSSNNESVLNIRFWDGDGADTDIGAIIPGFSNFGTLIEGCEHKQFVIGLDSNNADDGFHIISKENDNPNYTKNCFSVKSNGEAVFSDEVVINGNGNTIGGSNFNNGSLKIGSSSAGIAIDTDEIYQAGASIFDIGTSAPIIRFRTNGADRLVMGTVTTTIDGHVVWTAGTDGPNSGLDADTVDGFEASEIMQLANAQDVTGEKTFLNKLSVDVSDGEAAKFEVNATGGLEFNRSNNVGNNFTHFRLDFTNSDSSVAQIRTVNTSGGISSIGSNYRLDISSGDSIALLTQDVNRLTIDNDGAVVLRSNGVDSALTILDINGSSTRSDIRFVTQNLGDEQSVRLRYEASNGSLLENGYALKIESDGSPAESGEKAHLEVEGNIYSDGARVYTSDDATSIDYSTSEGELIKVGDYGFGKGPNPKPLDYDNLTAPGYYFPDGTSANRPVGDAMLLHVLAGQSNGGAGTNDRIIQMAYRDGGSTDQVWMRTFAGVSWSDWSQLHTSSSNAATISLFGNGQTIGNSNFDNGWLRIGNSSAGIAIDNNEIYCVGSNLNLGTLEAGRDIVFKPNGVEKFNVGESLTQCKTKLDVASFDSPFSPAITFDGGIAGIAHDDIGGGSETISLLGANGGSDGVLFSVGSTQATCIGKLVVANGPINCADHIDLTGVTGLFDPVIKFEGGNAGLSYSGTGSAETVSLFGTDGAGILSAYLLVGTNIIMNGVVSINGGNLKVNGNVIEEVGTPINGDDAANKDYVDQGIGNLSTQNSSYNMTLANSGGHLIKHTSSTSHTYTLTNDSTGGWDSAEVDAPSFTIVNDGSGSVTLSPSGVTLRLAEFGDTGDVVIPQYCMCTAVRIGANSWYISGAGIQ